MQHDVSQNRPPAYAGMASYYAASAHPAPQRPKLSGKETADVCIVGAGFTGMSAALELAEKGFNVIVLEAERVGFGASGRNGGQLVNGYSRSLGHIGRHYGEEAERNCGEMALEGATIIRDRIDRFGIECDFAEGGVVAALNERHMRSLREQTEEWHRHGHTSVHMVDRDGIRAHVGSDQYVGGMVDPYGGHFHPLNFLLGEARAFEAMSGRIFESSRVTGVSQGQKPIVKTEDGEVQADHVLLCGNAYLGNAVPKLTQQIMPVSSQVIATEPLGSELAQQLLPTRHCIEDSRFVLDYFRLSADNRLLYGGGTVYGARDIASITGRIRPGMLKTFPQLADVKIDYAWSGNFALTMTRIPQIGRLSDNVLFSHGDSGHGVTTTQMLGRRLAEAVDGDPAKFDTLAAFPYLPFIGGRLFRVPATVLGSWYYSLRDKLGI
nr:FAD-binding oxidoreductase [Henriciella litoralis]